MDSKIPPVRIGFYDPFNVYDHLQEALNSRIHLTNMHWRKSTKDPLRSITSLPFQLFEETPKAFDNSTVGPDFALNSLPIDQQRGTVVDMLRTPYVRMMFLQCDDIESYRATARPLIKEWVKSNVKGAHAPVEWYLILYSADSKPHNKLFDKLKVDFEADMGSEKCILVRAKYATPSEENELWGSVNLALKQSILASFSKRFEILSTGLSTLSSDIKSNFKVYLALKQGIASQMLSLHLLDDALVEFDGLSSLVSTYQDDHTLFPPQSWSDQDPHSMEQYMTQPTLVQKGNDSYSLYQVKSFIFSKIFTIFEGLSGAASSLSLSSLHVAEFLRRLQNYIQEISSDFASDSGDTLELEEWAYMIVNDVMSLDICVKMAATGADDNGDSSQISERFGELLLLQRSKLLDIGQGFNYYINGVLTDIRLSSTSVPLEITYGPLKEVLASEKNFQDHFILLTETAINHFGISERPRTVDALSIDIALLDYENKQYEKAAIVLSTCPEFYGTQGWDLIGFSLLEAYIDCLENMDSKSDFFVSGEHPVGKEDLLCQCYISVLASLKTSENALSPSLVKSAIDYLSNKPYDNGMDQPSEFGNFLSIYPSAYVTSEGNDTYQIKVELESKIPYGVMLKDLKLILEDSKGETIEFENDYVDLIPGRSEISLSTDSIQFGAFKLATFAAKFGPISMIHVFEGDSKKEVDIFPIRGNLRLRIDSPTEIDLNVKPLSVFIDVGSEIGDAILKVWRLVDSFSILDDVVVKSQDGTKIDCFSVTEDSISIASLEGNTKYEVIIPFQTAENPKRKIIDLYASLVYNVGNSSRQQTVFKHIDPSLSIAVSVQDIFKSDGLYSRFTVGTGEAESPIRIVSVDLQPSENFEVMSPLKPGPLIAFGDQPGNFFFKISEKQGVVPGKEEHLDLGITYRELNQEILDVWIRQLLKDLEEKNIHQYIEIICHCSTELKFDHNEYVLNNSLKVINPSKLLKSPFNSIPELERDQVLSMFVDRIENGFSFNPLEIEWNNKKLNISVLIPTVEVIHTIELKLDEGLTHVALGDVINTSLEITSLVSSSTESKAVKSSAKKRVLFDGEQSTLNKYSVEILASLDTWLINGRTKFVVEIDKSEKKVHAFPPTALTLIPLKVGKLALPKIKMKNLNMNSKNEYLMEVDYKNDSETINVVSSYV